jgi:hypothetical protein
MPATTLVAVTGSTVPYIYDLPHLLSLPPGFEGRFRYDRRWVDPQVRQALEAKESAKALGGAKVLLTFHSRESRRLLPVRAGTVISVERLGPLYYLRFTVEEFVCVPREVVDSEDPGAAAAAASTALEQFGIDLLGASDWNLAEGLPNGKYLFITTGGGDAWRAFQSSQRLGSPPPEQALGTIDQQWARVVSLLRDEPHLSGIPMFHLHGIVDRAGRLRKPSEMQNSFARTGLNSSGYRLVDGDRYRLRLIQWRGRSSADPERRYRAVCEVDETTVHLEGKSDLVLGWYDILEYSLRAIMPGYSELLLRADVIAPNAAGAAASSPPEEAAWPQVYTVRVPVQVRRRWRRVFGALALGFAGAVLLLGPSIVPVWFPALQPHLTDAVRTVLQFFGTLLIFVAYGSFLSGYVKFAGDTQKLISPPSGGGAK